MALKLNKLTALGVSKLSRPGYYSDGGGLLLQVSPSGSKSWIFRFQLSRKRREMGLGSLHAVDLANARSKAKECRLLLSSGLDPIEVRAEASVAEATRKAKVMTFDQCAAAYIKAHRSGWRNEKHIAQWGATIASPVCSCAKYSFSFRTDASPVRTNYASRLVGGLRMQLLSHYEPPFSDQIEYDSECSFCKITFADPADV